MNVSRLYSVLERAVFSQDKTITLSANHSLPPFVPIRMSVCSVHADEFLKSHLCGNSGEFHHGLYNQIRSQPCRFPRLSQQMTP